MIFILKLFLALVPSFLFIYYLLEIDLYRYHSSKRLFIILVFGSIVVLVAYLFMNILVPVMTSINMFSTDTKDQLLTHFLTAGMLEEWSKLFFIFLILFVLEKTEKRYEIVLYTCSLGALFAAFENIVIPQYFNETTLAVRTITAVPAHILFSFIMSELLYRFAVEKKPDRKWGWLFSAWLAPALLHGLYNSAAFLITDFAMKRGINPLSAVYLFSALILGSVFILFVSRIKKRLEAETHVRLFEKPESNLKVD